MYSHLYFFRFIQICFLTNQFQEICTLPNNQNYNITTYKYHEIEIPKSYLVSYKNHYLRQLSCKNLIGETQSNKKKYGEILNYHYLADKAHHILNQLHSSQPIEKVKICLWVYYYDKLLLKFVLRISQKSLYKLHLNAAPSFVITPAYAATLLAHPKSTQIQTAINAAITAYQSVVSSVGATTILFNISSTGLGNSIFLVVNGTF